MTAPIELAIRLGAFALAFTTLALAEVALPRRTTAFKRRLRWPSNLGIVALDTLLVRIAFPTAAVGLAIIAQSGGWGLLNLVAFPVWAEATTAFILLDLIIYGQHRLFHAVPIFWRFHRMHHADMEFDFTTGVRFHPVEILLSMLIKLTAVVIIGAPALTVLLFEVVLNASSMFNHANIKLPIRLDRIIRQLIVTPDMHRVHHSVIRCENDSNFGFNLATWDRWFGTYRAEPELGHVKMTIGLWEFRDPAELRLDRMLIQPLKREITVRETH